MNHRTSQLLFGFVIAVIGSCGSPLFSQTKPAVDSSAERIDPAQQQSSLLRLSQMNPEEIVELKRKKRQFDELSVQQQKRVRELHASLQSQSNRTELSAVMSRYYAWLRHLERDERNSLLDLPPTERLEQIKKLHEERARKLFGTIGATKLPSQDVKPFIEWINDFKKNKKTEISDHFESAEGQQALQRWREVQRRSGRRFRGIAGRANGQRGRQSINSERSEQRDNVRFNIFMDADPEFMAELIHKEIDSLMAKLSQEAIQILEEQNAKEQKLLVYNWAADWARQISSTRGISDEEIQQFYETLSEKDKETLDTLSPSGWRRRLEELYRRQQRRRGVEPPDSLPGENRLGKKINQDPTTLPPMSPEPADVGQSVPD